MPLPWLHQKGVPKPRRSPAEQRQLAEVRKMRDESRERKRRERIEDQIRAKYPDLFEAAMLERMKHDLGLSTKDAPMTVDQLLKATEVLGKVQKLAGKNVEKSDGSFLETILNSDAASSLFTAIGQMAGPKMAETIQMAQQQPHTEQPAQIAPAPQPEPAKPEEGGPVAVAISMGGKAKLLNILTGNNGQPQPPREAVASLLALAHDEPAIARLVSDLPRVPEAQLAPYVTALLASNNDLRSAGLGPWLQEHWAWFLSLHRELAEQTHAENAEEFAPHTTHSVGKSGL